MGFFIPSRLASLAGPIIWPGHTAGIGSAASFGAATTLDAAGEYHAMIFCAERDMVISHVGLKCAAASGSPTADIRIETVDASGLPSGNLWATNTNIVTATLTTTFAVHALTAAATIPRGAFFAIKVAYNSGTSFQTSRYSNILNLGLPYNVVNTGTPTKSATGGFTVFVPMSDATTPYHVTGIWPVIATGTATFNNTNGARRGLRFQVPFKCRCVGMAHYAGASVGDFNFGLWTDAGAELDSTLTAADGDQLANTNNAANRLFFDHSSILIPGTWYRAAIEPTSATNVSVSPFTLAGAGYRVAMPGGLNCHYTTYASSVWTDSATDQLALLDLLIDQLAS